MEINQENETNTQNKEDGLASQMHSQAKKLGTNLVLSILLVSILTGALAGFVSGLYVARNYRAVPTNTSKSAEIKEDSAIIDVVHKASPAVVSIIISKNLNAIQSNSDNPFFFDPFFQLGRQPQNSAPNYQQTGAGSGFFISSDGLIMTNKHVVSDEQAKYTVITNDGKSYDAQVLARDPNNDLALVKISINNAPTLNFADSSKVEIGQRVIAIGNSLGQYSNTVTSGIISGIGRNITANGEGTSEQLEGVFQTDAAINPGNSGGPLLNIFGDVIGVNTAVDQQGQLVGFAIPSLDAKKDVESFQKLDRIAKPFLGIRYVLITPAIKDQNNLPTDNGAYITAGQDENGNAQPAVVPGSPADKAGLKEGDIIVALNGDKIDKNTTLAILLKNYNPGDRITLQVLRGGKQLNVPVVLAENK